MFICGHLDSNVYIRHWLHLFFFLGACSFEWKLLWTCEFRTEGEVLMHVYIGFLHIAKFGFIVKLPILSASLSNRLFMKHLIEVSTTVDCLLRDIVSYTELKLICLSS